MCAHTGALGVLVHLGGFYTTNHILYQNIMDWVTFISHVLEAGSSRLGCWQIRCLLKSCFLGYRWLPSCLSSHDLSPLHVCGENASPGIFSSSYRGALILSRGSTLMTLSNPNYLSKAPSPITIMLGIRT